MVKTPTISFLNAFPNPFIHNLTITYELTRASNVELTLFDLSGRRLATLISEIKPIGEQIVCFDGTKLENGSYILELKTPDGVLKKQIVVSK